MYFKNSEANYSQKQTNKKKTVILANIYSKAKRVNSRNFFLFREILKEICLHLINNSEKAWAER